MIRKPPPSSPPTPTARCADCLRLTPVDTLRVLWRWLGVRADDTGEAAYDYEMPVGLCQRCAERALREKTAHVAVMGAGEKPE